MTLTAGVVTLSQAFSTEIDLSATAATGGTGSVTYQWYRSTTTGFSPGGGNIIAGATALTLHDTGLIPGTTYYYKLQATDQTPTTVTYTQFTAVTLAPSLSQNQFQQSTLLGKLDLQFNPDTVSVQVDISQTTPLPFGSAVKMVDSAGGAPKVVGCAADSDQVMGFINYNIRNATFSAGMQCEISMDQNVMYLYATAPIARGAKVQLDLTTVGGVAPVTVSSGACVVGWAYDKAVNAGDLIRIKLATPYVFGFA